MIARNKDADMPAELVREVLDHSLEALPEEGRANARRDLLEMLADVHRESGAEFPAWLTTLLAER